MAETEHSPKQRIRPTTGQKLSPKQRLARLGKRSAWVGGSLAAIAIYNHIDAGIVAAQADQSSTIRSSSGHIKLEYRHIPSDLVRVIAQVPDKIDQNLDQIPFAAEARNSLRSSPLKLEVRAALEWDDSSELLLRVGSDGTVRVNAGKLAKALQRSDASIPQQEYDDRVSSAIADSITVEVIDWANWRTVAQELKAKHLPLRLLASSDLQASILLSKYATSDFLSGVPPAPLFSALTSTWLPDDPILKYHIVAYSSLKSHLEATSGLVGAGSMLNGRASLINFAAAQSLSRYSDYFSWGVLTDSREVLNIQSLSELISRRREIAQREANHAGRVLLSKRLALTARDLSMPLLDGDQADIAAWRNISDTDLIENLSTRIMRLYLPFEEANDSAPVRKLCAATEALISSLVALYSPRYDPTKEKMPTWVNCKAIAAAVNLQQIVQSHFDPSERHQHLKRINSVALSAMEGLIDQISNSTAMPDLSAFDVANVICNTEKLVNRWPSDQELVRTSQLLKDSFQFASRFASTAPAAPFISDKTLNIIRSHLSAPEQTRLFLLCRSVVRMAHSNGGGDEWSELLAPDNLTEFLGSDFVADLSVRSRGHILRELANFSPQIGTNSSDLVLNPAVAHYDPTQRIKDFTDLRVIVEMLPARERAACVESILEIPPLLRSQLIERVIIVRNDMRRGDTNKVDSDIDNFGYFARTGVLASALEQTIERNPSMHRMVAFDVINHLTLGAAARTSWAANVDVYASSSAKQLSWGSLLADGQFASSFRNHIAELRAPLRKIFPLVEQDMDGFEIRSSRGVGWIVNRAGDVIDHGAGRPAAYGIFHQNPRQGLGRVDAETTPQVGAILVGKQYTSDFNSFSRGAQRWEGCLSEVYGTQIEVHPVNSSAQVREILKGVTRSAISNGKSDEFILVVAAHGSASPVKAEGLGLRSEGSRYTSAAWLESGYLEEGMLKSLINKEVAPYFKRVSIIFDSCHSGGWTE